MAGINAKPINVYGKVIDQFGQPVVDATVNGDTLLMISFERSGGETVSTITDAQGRFSFTGLHGARFGLKIEKAGYKYDTQLNVNWWNNYKPDPDNPAIFHMWKLQGAEPMVSDSKFYGIKPDGRFYTIDLINGTKTEGTTGQGDLIVQIIRPAQIQQGQKFDWSFTMQANDGGFIETTDPYLNEAPESGYQSQYTITMSANDPNWQEEVQDKTFYLESRNGTVYGQMRVTIIPNYNDTSVFKFESYVNPSGSRDLEIDPKKVTQAGKR